MEWLKIINFCVATLFTLCYAYQFFYLIVGCIKKPKSFPDTKRTNHYAILIAARNESVVIAHLIDSIHNQSYPQELIDTYVVADNCTDDTAKIAKEMGAIVYERFSEKHVGKGFALKLALRNIFSSKGQEYYDGYFVIDADNLLDKEYVSEMDKALNDGNKILTSYRNSKNYATNWISSGYALWFMHEAKHLNNPRFILGTSCAVSGTGFLVHRDVINEQGGWKHFLLTEDIEFSIDHIIKGYKIGYCHKAMLYDEQPVKFSQSWRQRLRWAKGFLQVVHKYGKDLIKSIFKGSGFSAVDMLFTIAPAFFISLAGVLINVFSVVYTAIFAREYFLTAFVEIVKLFWGIYLTLFIVGTACGITEWKNIRATTFKKVKSFFTFPLFMLTYLPISAVALFSRVHWAPIEHTDAVTIDDVTNSTP